MIQMKFWKNLLGSDSEDDLSIPDPKEHKADNEEYEGLNVKDVARELEQLHKITKNYVEVDVEDPPTENKQFYFCFICY